jgi:PD-(D/E)XK endonuclease
MPILQRNAKLQGDLAELRFMIRAAEEGLLVTRPYGDNSRYDFLIDSGRRYSRLQVKSTRVLNNGSYRIRCARGRAKTVYTAADIDFLAAYVIPLDVWYILPVNVLPPAAAIRVWPHLAQSARVYRRRALYPEQAGGMNAQRVPDPEQNARTNMRRVPHPERPRGSAGWVADPRHRFEQFRDAWRLLR